LAEDVESGNPLATAQGGRTRAIAFVRCIAFFLIAVVLGFGLIVAAQKFFGPINIDQTAGLKFLIPGEFALAFATVIVPSAIMALITREPATRFGFGRSGRFGQLLLGVVTGIVAMSVLIGLMALLGGVRTWSFTPLSVAPLTGAGYAVLFAIVAVSEEGLLRGYGLVQLSRAISFWPAAIITSVIFVVLHLGHKTESLIGLAQVGIIGLILAYSFRRTGALWFALGCHGAWDFAETYLYGVPDSGMTTPDALSHVVLQGPTWVTGGVTGPEASWLVFPVLAGVAMVVRFLLPRTAEK
jgi:membrane protease YdiL (CAAX protease family)